jgi:O-antigen/teichoic acid export membrane protein
LATRSLTLMGYAYAAICAPGIILAPIFIRYWIGPDFAVVSGPVAQILFLGSWMTGLSIVAYTLTQSQGRPDLTGKLHLAEALPFLGILWVLTLNFGINGAAVAWTLRCALDAFLMFWAAGMSRKDVASAAVRPAALLCGCGVASPFVGSSLALAFPASVLAGLIAVGLAYAYSDDIRQIVTSQLIRAWSFGAGVIQRMRPAQ